MNTAGIIPNFVDDSTLADWVKILKTFDEHNQHQIGGLDVIGASHGIDENNKRGYMWFNKVILSKLREHFDPNLGLVFGHYLNSCNAVRIHDDTFPDQIINGRPYISFLIPISVDNDNSLCEYSSTITVKPGTMTDSEYQQYFTHEKETIKNKYAIDNVMTWCTGDLIWWNSEVYHASNNFRTTSESKQSIVIHTYV